VSILEKAILDEMEAEAKAQSEVANEQAEIQRRIAALPPASRAEFERRLTDAQKPPSAGATMLSVCMLIAMFGVGYWMAFLAPLSGWLYVFGCLLMIMGGGGMAALLMLLILASAIGLWRCAAKARGVSLWSG
jgi:hypothetical protein